MREIKFRAWNEFRQKIESVLGLNFESEGKVFVHHPDGDTLRNGNSSQIMQFTGLHDKNGREIWEGDIVRLFYYEHFKSKEHIGIVEWEYDCWSVSKHSYRIEWADSEVIGNIWENPELSKEVLWNMS